MRFMIKILVSIVAVFIINVIFYFVSQDYRDFLKNLKINNWDAEQNINIYDTNEIIDENKQNEVILPPQDIHIPSELISETILWNNYTEILELFSSYDLKQLELNTNLFDITSEYPDQYYEFYSPNLTVYFFQSKRFDELFDIFDYLQKQTPYSINSLNNFGKSSFYINLDEQIVDNFIRIIIEHKGVVFWIKVHKDEYQNVKNILDTMK